MKYESVSCLIMQFEFFHFFSLFCVTYSYVYFVTYWSSKAIIYKEQQKRWRAKSFWFSVPMSFKTCSKKKKPWAFVNVGALCAPSAKTCLNKRQSLFWSSIPTSRTTLVATTFQCWNVTFVIIHIKSAKEALTKASLIINYKRPSSETKKASKFPWFRLVIRTGKCAKR